MQAHAIQASDIPPDEGKPYRFARDHSGWVIAIVSGLLTTVFTVGVSWEKFEMADRRISALENSNRELQQAVGEIKGDIRVIRTILEKKP